MTKDRPNSRDALIVFARAPEPRQVKTRLAAELGSVAALAIYRAMAGQVIAAVRARDGYSITVVFTPCDAEMAMREWLGASVALRTQSTGDLGERMAAAAATAFTGKAERVVMIGTDCPDVTAAVVEEAFEHLASSDIVLGPACDGGYYLIGMSRLHPSLFEGIPWGSHTTLQVTLERARAQGLSVSLLEERRDIDTASDWRAWLAAGQVAEPSG